MWYNGKISWKQEALLVNVTQEELSNIFEIFKCNGLECKTKSNWEEWHKSQYCYKVDSYGKFTYLFTYAKEYNYNKYKNVYVIYSTNNFDDNKNRHTTQNQGLNASVLVEKMFKEKNGLSLCGAFGYSDASIKYCVPKQFYFTNESNLGYQEHASAIDISSHYPSNLCGSLPDWHTRKEIEGTVEPNEEYPFAFYIKSGHSAEYNRYDTHNWIEHRLNLYLFDVKANPTLNPDEDITILCKASKYDLTDIMNYYYNQKCLGNPDAKLVMNAFIGNCHTNAYRTFKLSHIAAVCLARANDRLLSIIDEMWYPNIIQVCVDGIIYKGNRELGGYENALGAIKQEFLDCEIYTRSINNYIVKYNNKFIIAKHGGCNAWQDGTRLGTEEELLKQITSIDDCEKWKRIDYMENINGKV